MNKNTILSIALVVITYIVSTEISYAIFSAPSKTAVPSEPTSTSDELSFDDNLPKTEPCPLNGQKYSKKQRQWWEKHRPLGIMIENHEEARPQSGLSFADVVYEAVAEGGISRFLAVFYCQDAEYVGPVRSARTYFLDYISEYGNYPLYTHVGGAHCNKETGSGCLNGAKADALGQIEKYGWYLKNDLNEYSIGFPVFRRYEDRLKNVDTEHTVYSYTSKLWEYTAKKRGLSNIDKDGESWDTSFTPYEFRDDSQISERPAAQTVHVEFWEEYDKYDVDWEYDKTSNTYKRENGGLPHTDLNNKKQLAAKNVIVLFMEETNANDGYDNNLHLLYKNKGTGKAHIFMDGKETVGIWKKDTRTSRTLIFDNTNTPIKFNRGVLWFEILPTTGVLNVS